MMVIDTGTRVGKRTRSTRVEPPSEKHLVILHQPVNRNIPCTACLLKTVFNMSDKQAIEHAERARKNGAEPVLVGRPEIAESKAESANAAAQASSQTCHPRVRQVMFTTERAP